MPLSSSSFPPSSCQLIQVWWRPPAPPQLSCHLRRHLTLQHSQELSVCKCMCETNGPTPQHAASSPERGHLDSQIRHLGLGKTTWGSRCTYLQAQDCVATPGGRCWSPERQCPAPQQLTPAAGHGRCVPSAPPGQPAAFRRVERRAGCWSATPPCPGRSAWLQVHRVMGGLGRATLVDTFQLSGC